MDRLFVEWDTTRTPGAAVLITDGPEVVLERCYGMADLGQRKIAFRKIEPVSY